jgi:hypothetical protein
MFACDQTPHIPNQPDREREWKQKEKRKEKGWEYFEDEHLFNVRHRLLLFFLWIESKLKGILTCILDGKKVYKQKQTKFKS